MSDNQNGKGDKPRNCFSKQYKDNFSKINWKMEITNWQNRSIEIGDVDGAKMEKYADHIDELIRCLLGEKNPIYLITNESTVGHFIADDDNLARLKKLTKKYKLGAIKKDDYLIDVAEKMYDYRPF